MTVRRFVPILCLSLAVAITLRFAARKTEQSFQISHVAALPKPPDPGLSPRKIYPLSVIPGGAYSGEELARARRLDRVVEAHYSDFETGATTVRSLPQDTYFYVSYRKANRVFWTANRRRVPKGESVLCDGSHMARARCGNRLSEAPQLPIAAGPQPTEAALNAPEMPGGIALPEAPLFAPVYDAPAMPLGYPRDRLFAFPTGATGASPLAENFAPFAIPSPFMAVANLPFGAPGAAEITRPGGGSSPGGSTSGGSPSGSTPGGGSTPTGSSPGGSSPGGSSPGGSSPGGIIPGATVPEPASAALIALGAALLLLGYRHTRNPRA